MIKPPPIQEPWRMDTTGRLNSPAWLVWLQSIVSVAFPDGGLVTGNGTLGVNIPHNFLTEVLQADDTSASIVLEKHVTDAQVKKYEDHRLDATLHFPYEYVATTIDYSPTIGQFINCDCASNNIIITLPASGTGHPVIVRKSDATTNIVSITGLGDIAYQGTSIQCVFNGTDWMAT